MAVELHLARQDVGDLHAGGDARTVVGRRQEILDDLDLVRVGLGGRLAYADVRVLHAVGDGSGPDGLHRAVGAGGIQDLGHRGRRIDGRLEGDGGSRPGAQRAAGPEVRRRTEGAGRGILRVVGNDHASGRAGAAGLVVGRAIGTAAAAARRAAGGAAALGSAPAIAAVAAVGRRRGAGRGIGEIGIIARRIGAARGPAAAAVRR